MMKMKTSMLAAGALGVALSIVNGPGPEALADGRPDLDAAFVTPELFDDQYANRGSEMRPLIERYTTDERALHRYDRSPASNRRLNTFNRFYLEWRFAIDAIDFDSLSHDGQVDWILFRNLLDYELRNLEHERARLEEMAALLPFAGEIVDLENARRRIEPIDSAAAASRLAAIVEQISATRKAVESWIESNERAETDEPSNLLLEREITTATSLNEMTGAAPARTTGEEARDQATEDSASAVQPGAERASLASGVSASVANRAAETVDHLRWTLRGWFDFYNAYDPTFSWWMAAPFNDVDRALNDYADFLRDRVAGVDPDDENAIIGDPIGRDALLSELAFAMIPYTPEELIAIANEEFAWCEREMLRASNDMGFGDDWMAALEHVKSLHVEPGDQPALIVDLALEAIEFLDAHDLVTVPQFCRDNWRMDMMSPERQLITPFFTGGEVISVSFPTSGMTHEQKLMSMRANNIHFSRATVHHELIPGHHLQGFMTQRYRAYRDPFSTPFWGEGWALYWEMLLWDLDFQESPENRVGMLFWRMHRCARIIFSLSFHLEQMTPQECIDFLVDRVGHERDSATAEVRRSVGGSYGPLYQAAYMLGGLQIRAVHRELVDTGRMTDRAFHDAILRLNSIPIEMVRASLIDQPLTREFQSNWRFYGEPDVEGE